MTLFPTYIGVDEALQHILALCPRLPPEQVSLHDAAERVLAANVVAGLSFPPFANSAMDGFAARFADLLPGESTAPPLRVIGESVAGRGFAGKVAPGTAVRIMTGAEVPPGADTVVPIEESTPGEGDSILLHPRAAKPGQHIRQVGSDVTAGETVLHAGRVLHAAELALLAALGVAEIAVARRPRVALIATGNEVVPAGAPIEHSQVRDANTPLLAALVKRCGGLPIPLEIARDTETSLMQRLREALTHAPDLILTTAGVSVGDYDRVKEVLTANGSIAFWKVRMKPGKPLVAGLLRQEEHRGDGEKSVPMLGLPGNPASAFTSGEVFVRPALLHMQGRSAVLPRVRARLDAAVKGTTRQAYHPVCLYYDADQGHYGAALCGQGRDSHAISTLVEANSLLMVPEQGGYRVGEMVEVVPFAAWRAEESY